MEQVTPTLLARIFLRKDADRDSQQALAGNGVPPFGDR